MDSFVLAFADVMAILADSLRDLLDLFIYVESKILDSNVYGRLCSGVLFEVLRFIVYY